jgi:Ran GTPase-activating protein 1
LSEIPQALTHLLTALLALPELHTVNLSDNAFGLNTVAPLQPFLSQHVPLQHLILNNNGLGPSAGTLVAEALTSLASKKEQARKHGKTVPDLETVICGRNRLENGSMNAWVQAYSANNKIKTVRMVQNGIRQEGISALLQNGLSKCSALEVLDLQDNTFTAMGGRALAHALTNWIVIKELGVGDCLLSARGAVMLAEALKSKKNKTLQTLRLQYNEIDAKGIQALAKVAQTDALSALQRVELNGNKFSEEDTDVAALKTMLDERRQEMAPDGDEDDETWGLDELDDLEEDSDDEDEEQDDDEDAEEERIVKDADQAESENVAQEKDKSVDELADLMGKTELK